MEFLKKNPTIIAVVVIGLILLFLFHSKSNAQTTVSDTGGGGGVTFTGGGEVAPQIDPAVASIMEAQLAARTQDFQTTAGTVSGSQQTAAAQVVNLATIAEQQTLGLAQTNANVQTATINAETQQKIAQLNNNAQLAQIQAQKDVARASDNTSIVNKILDIGGGIIKSIFHF